VRVGFWGGRTMAVLLVVDGMMVGRIGNVAM